MKYCKSLLGHFAQLRWWLPVLTVLAISLFLIITSPSEAVAQEADDEPLWRAKLTCDPMQRKYEGIEYCTGLDSHAHVLVIDLKAEPGIRFEYVIAGGEDRHHNTGECRDVNIPDWSSGPGCADPDKPYFYPVMSLMDAVGRFSAAAAVMNTDYGAHDQGLPKSREHGPEGLTVVAGNRLDGPLPNGPNDTDNNAVRRPWVAISESAPFQVLFDKLDSDDGSKPQTWMYTAFGGAPWLIRDGQKQVDQIKSCTNAKQWSCISTEAQTAVALSQDRRWLYLVVVEGVAPEPNTDDNGADVITDFMLEALEPWEAIKLDGGGSSQMWYAGLPSGERSVTPDSRLLSHYLAIIAPPGNGIDWAPEDSNPLLPDLGSWWDIILMEIQKRWAEALLLLQERMTDWWERTQDDIEQRVADWWEQKQDDIEQRINAWWAEQMAALTRWLEAELLRALNQMCGAAMILPVGLAAIIWRQSKRRK